MASSPRRGEHSNTPDASKFRRRVYASWSSFLFRFIGAYAIYGVAQHIFSPWPLTANISSLEKLFVYYAAGYLSMFLLLYFVVVSLMATAKFSRLRRREGYMPQLLSNALIPALAVGALLIFGGWYGKSSYLKDQASNSSAALVGVRSNDAAASSSTDITALVVRQNSKGVTNSRFDQDFLVNLKNWMTNQILTKAKKHFVENGNNPDDFHPNVDTDSVYVKVEGKKLAVIRLTFNDKTRVVWITGISPPELVRVICFRRQNEEIPIFHGKCGSEVTKTFDIKNIDR